MFAESKDVPYKKEGRPSKHSCLLLDREGYSTPLKMGDLPLRSSVSLEGTLCIFRGNQIVFSNKEPHPLLFNLVKGFEDIGQKLFAQHLKLIKAPPFTFGVFYKGEVVVVIIEKTEDKVYDSYEKSKSIVDKYQDGDLV